MIDEDLAAELETARRQVGGIMRLHDDAADMYVSELAKRFVDDGGATWWWESLRPPTKRLNYGHSDGLSMLVNLIDSESDVIMVVTDDAPPPWHVYLARPQKLVALLRECRFFEYFVAATDRRWIIFDTHQNDLILGGTLAK